MRYSTEPRERTYVKGYGFLSFGRNIGRNLSYKNGKKLVDTAKISATDAFKIASKSAIQKTAEATRDIVGNEITDKVTKISKYLQVTHTQMQLAMKYQKKHIYLNKKDKKLYMN